MLETRVDVIDLSTFVETSPMGNICNPDDAPCIGGFARLATAVREGFDREPDSLLLNGGDSFQGTIWYNILRWNVTKEFMNMLPHDAHVLGNHEFDNGIEGVVPYLKELNDKVVTANIIDDDEPTIQGLYDKSITVIKKGRRIGIIGVLIATTNTLASTGQLRFTDEVQAVKEEAEKLNYQGVDIIVVLSHCGLDIDMEIALHGGPHIDIIVGGHSHTLLYNGDVPENSGFDALGPYPVVVNQIDTQRPVLNKAENNNWHYAHFCVTNQGGIRSDINPGVITYESVMMATPFENNVEVFELKGEHILEMLEYSVANTPYPGARMLQVSGLRATFDGLRPLNERVLNVSIRCIECDVPRYEPIQLDKYYRVVSQDFIGNGGGDYTMLSNNRINVEVIGVDYDIIMDYISRQSPVYVEADGRMQISSPCTD